MSEDSNVVEIDQRDLPPPAREVLINHIYGLHITLDHIGWDHIDALRAEHPEADGCDVLIVKGERRYEMTRAEFYARLGIEE